MREKYDDIKNVWGIKYGKNFRVHKIRFIRQILVYGCLEKIGWVFVYGEFFIFFNSSFRVLGTRRKRKIMST